MHGADTARLQFRGRSDAREQQNLRRLQGAGAEDHLAAGTHLMLLAVVLVEHPRGTTGRHQYPQDECVRVQRDIAARECRPQKGLGGGLTPATADDALAKADAFVGRAGEVFGAGKAQARGGGDEIPVQPIRPARPHHVHGTAVTVVGGHRQILVVLAAHEVRQHLGITPAGGTGGDPVLVVTRIAA